MTSKYFSSKANVKSLSLTDILIAHDKNLILSFLKVLPEVLTISDLKRPPDFLRL